MKTSTDGLFKHMQRDVSFTLVVKDFGIKHTKEEDVEHLTKCMREKCTFKADCDAKQCVGIHLKWDCCKRELPFSMKGHAKQALEELGCVLRNKLQAAPSEAMRPDWGQKCNAQTCVTQRH